MELMLTHWVHAYGLRLVVAFTLFIGIVTYWNGVWPVDTVFSVCLRRIVGRHPLQGAGLSVFLDVRGNAPDEVDPGPNKHNERYNLGNGRRRP